MRVWFAAGAAVLTLLGVSSTAAAQQSLPTGRTEYRDMASTLAEMQALAAANPDKVKLITLSRKSLLGRDIQGMEIAHRVHEDDGRPTFFLGGVMHAREWPSVEYAMEFAHDLLNKDGTDQRATTLLENGRVTIVPIQNPDGYDVSRRNVNGNHQKRGNCRFAPGVIPTQEQCDAPNSVNYGINGNRSNLPFWGGRGSSSSLTNTNYRGEAPLSEPENAAFSDYLSSHNVTASVVGHTAGNQLLHVQSSRDEPDPIADGSKLDEVTQGMISRAMPGGWVGGSWTRVYYEATSTQEQQAYYTNGTFGWTMETTLGATGSESRWHPNYGLVINQFTGQGPFAGQPVREMYYELYATSQRADLHSVLKGSAPPGVKLSLSKAFTVNTALTVWTPGQPAEVRSYPQAVNYSMTVPSTGRFEFHVSPSLRPSQYTSEFLPEAYTVTCTAPDGTVLETNTVTLARGQQVTQSFCTQGGVGGTVSPTLALTLGPASTFTPFTPGVEATYEAQGTATVVSTAGDATLSVADPSPTRPGHLVNGAYSLPQPLQVSATSAGGAPGSYVTVGAEPQPALSYSGPIANDLLALRFRQRIGATDALRTGTYSKTVVFTLSTTNP